MKLSGPTSHHYDYPHAFSGVDQLVPYGTRYMPLSNLLLVFVLACLVSDIIFRHKAGKGLTPYLVPLQIYILAVLSAVLLPRVIFLPNYTAPFESLDREAIVRRGDFRVLPARRNDSKKMAPGRFCRFRRCILFLLIRGYRQDQSHGGPGRTLRAASAPGPADHCHHMALRRLKGFTNHIVDRSCDGYCFSYGNYEPSSQQFRVRANPGNRFVTASAEASDAISSGEYIVQPGDLPIFEIYQCNLNMTELCMRELVPGEKNGRVGVHPVHHQ